MKLKSEPGIVVSAAAHAALLAAALISFSETKTFTDATEAVPVEMITDSQFNEVTKGVRDAPKPQQKPVVDQQSPVEDNKPQPVEQEAKVDVPLPPPPLKRLPDPGEEETPPEPPKRVAALPPPEPEPPKPQIVRPEPPRPPVRPPEPPKVEAKPEPLKPEKAEAIEPPKPPQRPKEPPKAEAKPAPEPPKAPPRPKPPQKVAEKPPEKPSLDKTALAKMLDDKKAESVKPPARPKSGRESNEQARQFDPNAISNLLSKEAPGRRPSTGAAPSRLASLGAPNATAARMSPSLWGQLDGYMQEQYKRCWNYLPTGAVGRYVPQIDVSFLPDGRLAHEPRLRNPPSDPGLRSLAESALRAVKNPLCNPLRIPAQFQPFYQEWKDRILRFDPEEMMG